MATNDADLSDEPEVPSGRPSDEEPELSSDIIFTEEPKEQDPQVVALHDKPQSRTTSTVSANEKPRRQVLFDTFSRDAHKERSPTATEAVPTPVMPKKEVIVILSSDEEDNNAQG